MMKKSVFFLLSLFIVQGCAVTNTTEDLLVLRVVPSKIECRTNDVVQGQCVVENHFSYRYRLFVGDLSRELLRYEAEFPESPLERWNRVELRMVSPSVHVYVDAGGVYSAPWSFRFTEPGRYRIVFDIDNGTRHLSESSEILVHQ